MDVLGRDDEVSSLHAFLDRPGDGGMAGLVLEGEAGIGKSTLWLAGVEAARERGLRVLSSRPAEVELGVAHAGLGDLLEDALGDVLPTSWKLPGVVRSRPRCCSGRTAGAPVDFRTLAVAVRSALQVLAERRPILLAVDDVQWLDAPSRTRWSSRCGDCRATNIRLLLARRLGGGTGVRSSSLRWTSDLIERVHVGPLSPGALHAILQPRLGRAFARPTLLRLHEAVGRQPLLRARARPRPRRQTSTRPSRCPSPRRWRRSSGLVSTGCRTRRAERCCSPARTAGSTPAQLDGDALEPAFADNVIELADGVDPLHAPAARLRALSGRFAERSAPRARTIGRDRRRSARACAPSRACSG